MTKRSTPVKTKISNVPGIPQEIVDEILDHLATNLGIKSLRPYALVSRSWVPSCRRHLFRSVVFHSKNMDKWLKMFPVPEESSAHYHVRCLGFWIRGTYSIPEQFLNYTPWSPNAERISLLGSGRHPLLRTPSFWRLPQSVTAFIIGADVFNLVQVRDIMAQLPNLDDLQLSGSLIAVDGGMFPRIGTSLRGRFGGRLSLAGGYCDKSVMDMLLEACCETLVQLAFFASP